MLMDKISTSAGKVYLKKHSPELTSSLKLGQVVQGKIDKAFSTTKYLINIKGNLLVAESNLQFAEGQRVALQVKQLKPFVEFKLIDLKVTEQELAAKLGLIENMSMKGLPVSRKTIEMADLFAKYGVEFNTEHIKQVDKWTTEIFSGLKVQLSRTEMLEIVAFLLKQKADVTKNNIMAARWLLLSDQNIASKLQLLYMQPKYKEKLKKLMYNLDGKKALRDVVKDLGYFYESKIKDGNQQALQNDLKYLLLNEDSRAAAKLLEDINYLQLLSLIGSSSYLQIPMLSNETISAFDVSSRKTGDGYSVAIRLKLDKLGDITVHIKEENAHLRISFFAVKTTLDVIRKNITTIEGKLISLGYVIDEIRYVETAKNESQRKIQEHIDYYV